MDPVKLLKQDHRHVKSLFRKFERSKSRAEKQKLGEQIIEELSVHATIEEQLIYPALRAGDKRKEGAVLNALEEHHAVKMTLAELDKMKVGDERYDAKMHVVREAVEMHIEEEEESLLPRLEALLEPDQARELAENMRIMKMAAPDHPHPMAPDTPPGNMVTGVFAKLTDAAKDMVRKVTSKQKADGHRRVVKRAAAQATKSRGRNREAPRPRA